MASQRAATQRCGRSPPVSGPGGGLGQRRLGLLEFRVGTPDSPHRSDEGRAGSAGPHIVSGPCGSRRSSRQPHRSEALRSWRQRNPGPLGPGQARSFAGVEHKPWTKWQVLATPVVESRRRSWRAPRRAGGQRTTGGRVLTSGGAPTTFRVDRDTSERGDASCSLSLRPPEILEWRSILHSNDSARAC